MGKGIYYTTISQKQINIIYSHSSLKAPEKDGTIRLSRSMMNFLYQIAGCGGGRAFDKQEEEFRRKIYESVGAILAGDIRGAEDLIHNAFQVFCLYRRNDALDRIQEELPELKRA